MQESSKNIYKVDLDYESYLFNPNYNESNPINEKIIKEFEYVFFLVNQENCQLKNIKSYPVEYLTMLTEMGFLIPEFTANTSNFKYWWGCRHNKNIEQTLNSKLTSAEYGKTSGLGFFDGAIVSSYEEIETHLSLNSSEKWIIKSPFSFSGIGHYVFDRNEIPLIKFDHKFLLEPIYKRVLDLGVTFEMSNGVFHRMFIVINFNNDKGSFKGGLGAKSVEDMLEYIYQNYNFNLTPHLDSYYRIFEHYQKLGAVGNVQIDSFIYKENDELKLYPLVEVNYRKTMGLVIQALADKSDAKFIEWRVTHTGEYENKSEWKKLSPPNNKFNSYFKAHISDKVLQ